MLDLDKYIDNNIEMKIGGEVIHVMQPTVSMIDKIDTINEQSTEGSSYEKAVDAVVLMLNHNKEGKKFNKKDLYDWTYEAISKVMTTISLLRYEAETNPN